MAPVRRRMTVSGRVQGVWFRDTCQRVARDLGVTGWVRNCDDGRVEIVAEGEPAAVAQMEAWARVGPRRAVVTNVVVVDEQPAGDAGFRIR